MLSPIQLRHRDFIDILRDALRTNGEPLRSASRSRKVSSWKTSTRRWRSCARSRQLPVHIAQDRPDVHHRDADDPDTLMLVPTIVSLAHSLHLKVVAEGVETEDQTKMLRLLRCDRMQGT
jgi:hypothetical protein